MLPGPFPLLSLDRGLRRSSCQDGLLYAFLEVWCVEGVTFVYCRLMECQALCWECRGKTARVLKPIAWRMCIVHQGVGEGKTSSGENVPEEVTFIWVLKDE